MSLKRISASKFTVAVIVLACLFWSGRAGAQSLSDFDWNGFRELRGEPEMQTHTDPFTTGVSAAEDLTVEDLQLTGIVYRGPNDAFALVSGYLVRPGDLIAGYRIDAIEKDRVRLKRIDDIFVLVLGGGI